MDLQKDCSQFSIEKSNYYTKTTCLNLIECKRSSYKDYYSEFNDIDNQIDPMQKNDKILLNERNMKKKFFPIK